MISCSAASVWVVLAAAEPAAAPVEVPAPAASDTDEPVAAAPRVLVWTAGASDPIAAERLARVRAELEAAGLRTVLFVAPDGAEAEVAGELATLDARLAIWLAADRERAEIFAAEADGLASVAIVTGDAAVEDEGSTFAVRNAEVVRALLLEPVAIVEAPVHAEPPAPTPAPPRPWLPRYGARVGLALAGTRSDAGVLLGPELGAGVLLGRRRRMGLDLDATVTALRGRVRGEAGTARLGWLLARVHAGVWPWPTARVAPFFALGGGVLVAWTRGDARAPYRGRSDVTAVAVASAAIDLAIRIAPRLRLRLGGRLGVALPALAIDTGAASVRTGMPIGEGRIAIELVGPRRRR